VRASALLLFISRTTNEQPASRWSRTPMTRVQRGEPGAQGTLRGLVVHGMAGFDYARARTVLGIPRTSPSRRWRPSQAGTQGRFARGFSARELPNSRKPLTELCLEGRYRARPPGLGQDGRGPERKAPKGAFTSSSARRAAVTLRAHAVAVGEQAPPRRPANAGGHWASDEHDAASSSRSR
jgi:hypothetical protein